MSETSPYAADALEQLASSTGDGLQLFALLDGARDPLIYPELIASGMSHASLFDGTLPPDLAAAAPYLVDLESGESSYAEWLLQEAWGKSWGVFLLCGRRLGKLRKHFRTFLLVEHEGKDVYFRYYDPRVLRVFLPTCGPEELAHVYGPVEAYFCEAKDPKTLLRFERCDEGLAMDEVALTAAEEVA